MARVGQGRENREGGKGGEQMVGYQSWRAWDYNGREK